MEYVLWVSGVTASLYLLHRLALWAEGQGWIYYRRRKGSSGSLSHAFLEVHSLLEPSTRYVLEEKRRDHSEEVYSGEN